MKHPDTGRVTARYEGKGNNAPNFQVRTPLASDAGKVMTMAPGSAMTPPRHLSLHNDGQQFQRLLCLPLSESVDQKDALASTTLTSSPCRSPWHHPGSSQYTAGSRRGEYHWPWATSSTRHWPQPPRSHQTTWQEPFDQSSAWVSSSVRRLRRSTSPRTGKSARLIHGTKR